VNSTQTAGHKDSLFAHIDPAKDLPPPDINESYVNFTSVHHINPSSEYDDEQLIPGSTHLGYRNPPNIDHPSVLTAHLNPLMMTTAPSATVPSLYYANVPSGFVSSTVDNKSSSAIDTTAVVYDNVPLGDPITNTNSTINL